MALDLEQIMILLQKRYRAFQEINRLTSELGAIMSRRDEVSAAILLDMRGDEIATADRCYQQIWDMSRESPEAASRIRELITSDPAAYPSESFEEQKIYEIRRKTTALIKEIQEKDRMLNTRVGGDKSYYCKTNR